MAKAWTNEEFDFLAANWGTLSPQEIADKLNRPIEGVIKKVNLLKLPTNRWTEEAIVYLKENYGQVDFEVMATALNKTVNSVKCQAKRLGLKGDYKNTWKQDEDMFLIENYAVCTASEIANTLNRSVSSITSRAHTLGLCNKVTIWTDDEIDYLTSQWNNEKVHIIMNTLGRTEAALFRRVSMLGLGIIKDEALWIKEEWLDEEISFIKENMNTMGLKDIAKVLHIPCTTLRIYMENIGLKINERLWTKDEERFLVENYKNTSWEVLQNTLNRKREAIIKKAVWMGLSDTRLVWTKEDENYLQEKWGHTQIKTIAKNLGRTEEAIFLKAHKLGLRKQSTADGEFLSPSEVATALGVTTKTVYYWIDTEILLAKSFKMNNCIRHRITVDDLKEFLCNFKNRWNCTSADMPLIKSYFSTFTITEKDKFYVYDKTPQWLLDKIEKDKNNTQTPRPWTTKEEKEALKLFKEGMSIKDISAYLNRSLHSVYGKIYKLEIAS